LFSAFAVIGSNKLRAGGRRQLSAAIRSTTRLGSAAGARDDKHRRDVPQLS
jgi:hypothetical protein